MLTTELYKCLKLDNRYLYDRVCVESYRISDVRTNCGYDASTIFMVVDILTNLNLIDVVLLLVSSSNNTNINNPISLETNTAVVIENAFLYDVLLSNLTTVYPFNSVSTDCIINQDIIYQAMASHIDDYVVSNALTVDMEVITSCAIDLLSVLLDGVLSELLYSFIEDLTGETIIYTSSRDGSLNFLTK